MRCSAVVSGPTAPEPTPRWRASSQTWALPLRASWRERITAAAGAQLVPGIFAAVPYCIDLIGGPYLETDDTFCKAFRPKSAQRPPRG